MPRSIRIEVPCAHCGKMLSRPPSLVSRSKNVFCNTSCHMAFKTAQGTTRVACAQCGAMLTRNRWQMAHMTHHFCDPACGNAYRMGRALPNRERKVQTTCAQCGRVFTHIPAKKRIYCSKACAARALGDRVIAENRPARQFVARVQVICAECGKPLERLPILAAKSRQYFCDKTCKATWHGKHIRGDAHPLYSRVAATCTQCGKPMTVSNRHAQKTSNQFCTMECYREWRPGRNTGPESPTWRGGNRAKYYGPNWKQQRRKARQRDGYRCRYCGVSERTLNCELTVHHLTPFRTYGLARYLEANDLSNLITLCQSCHPSAEAGKIALQPRLI